MKNFLFILCFLLSQSILSQEDKKWAFEITNAVDRYLISQNLGGILFTSDDTGYFIARSRFNYTLGFSLLRKLNSKVSIGLGFQYSNRDIEGPHCSCLSCDKIYYLFLNPDVINIDLLEIPVFLNLNLRKDSEKFMPYFKAGFTSSKILNNEYADVYRKLRINGVIGIACRYRINDSINLTLEGNYKHLFTLKSQYTRIIYSGFSLQLGFQTSF